MLIMFGSVTSVSDMETEPSSSWQDGTLVACDPIRARSSIFEGSLAEKLCF